MAGRRRAHWPLAEATNFDLLGPEAMAKLSRHSAVEYRTRRRVPNFKVASAGAFGQIVVVVSSRPSVAMDGGTAAAAAEL